MYRPTARKKKALAIFRMWMYNLPYRIPEGWMPFFGIIWLNSFVHRTSRTLEGLVTKSDQSRTFLSFFFSTGSYPPAGAIRPAISAAGKTFIGSVNGNFLQEYKIMWIISLSFSNFETVNKPLAWAGYSDLFGTRCLFTFKVYNVGLPLL